MPDDKITRAQFAERMKQKYPQYAGVPDDRLVDAIVTKYPQYREKILDLTMSPAGSVSAPPTGIAGVKAAGYTGAARLAELVKNNMDLIAGTAGGLLGAPAGGLGAVGGAALGGAAGRAVKQLLGIQEGKGMPSSGAAAADIALGGLEQGAYELGGMGLAKLGRVISPTDRASFLAYGTRSGEIGPKIANVLPDLDRVLAQAKKVPALEGAAPKKMTIGSFEKLVELADKDLNQEFNRAIFPIAQRPEATLSVGQAIRSKITPNLEKTAQGRAAKKYLEDRALEFENKTWTIAELNKERELVTRRLRAWHAAERSGQTAQERVQAKIAADAETERALKDLLYSAADRSGAKPPGYFTALKRKQSYLIDLMDSIGTTKEKLTKASMERQGAPLSEKLHLRGYLHPTTGAPGGVAGIAPAMFSDPLVGANKAIAKGFPTGTRRALQTTRGVVSKTLSQRDVDALPLRVLFGDYSAEEPK